MVAWITGGHAHGVENIFGDNGTVFNNSEIVFPILIDWVVLINGKQQHPSAGDVNVGIMKRQVYTNRTSGK